MRSSLDSLRGTHEDLRWSDTKFKLIAATFVVALSTPASAALLVFTTTGINVEADGKFEGTVE
jgi:hypothetical protein